ncbi:MAG: LPS translocon maturation chaperone LptM [Alphaproteobacteria bacterium]
MKNMMSRWLGQALIVALVLAMATPLGACGRKGAPEYPEGARYPQEYPKK